MPLPPREWQTGYADGVRTRDGFEWYGLRPGPHTLVLQKPDGEIEERKVEVPAKDGPLSFL